MKEDGKLPRFVLSIRVDFVFELINLILGSKPDAGTDTKRQWSNGEAQRSR